MEHVNRYDAVIVGFCNGVKPLAPRWGSGKRTHRKSARGDLQRGRGQIGAGAGGLQFTCISLDDFRIVRSAVPVTATAPPGGWDAAPYSMSLDPPFSRVGITGREIIEAGYAVKVARLLAGSFLYDTRRRQAG